MVMAPLLLALAVGLGLWPARAPGNSSTKLPAAAALVRTDDLQEPLVITQQTAIRLDGSPCRYEQIPAGAVITGAEVAPDRRTLLRIHFRSPK